MQYLSSQDQKLVPIPVVDNIIKEIREINADIQRLNSTNMQQISSPPRLVEAKKSAYPGSPVRGREQEVAMKLVELHAKVNRVLSRSGSPVRPRTETLKQSSPVRMYREEPKQASPIKLFRTEDLKRSSPVATTADDIRTNIHHMKMSDLFEQIDKVDKVLARSRSGSPVDVSRVEQTPVYTSSVIKLNSASRSASVPRYAEEAAKKSAAPIRSRPTYDYISSPTRETELRSASILSTSTTTVYPTGPAKIYSGNTVLNVWPNASGKFDHNKINGIVHRIAVRQALENAQNSPLGRRTSAAGYEYTKTNSFVMSNY